MIKEDLMFCARECLKNNECCASDDCRHYLDYEEDLNCCNIAVFKNGSMTLRQIAKRMGLSFGRIKQIETKALFKIKNRFSEGEEYLAASGDVEFLTLSL